MFEVSPKYPRTLNKRIKNRKRMNVSARVLFGLVGLLSAQVQADEFNHRYSQGDNVNFYVHKVRCFRDVSCLAASFQLEVPLDELHS